MPPSPNEGAGEYARKSCHKRAARMGANMLPSLKPAPPCSVYHSNVSSSTMNLIADEDEEEKKDEEEEAPAETLTTSRTRARGPHTPTPTVEMPFATLQSLMSPAMRSRSGRPPSATDSGSSSPPVSPRSRSASEA